MANLGKFKGMIPKIMTVNIDSIYSFVLRKTVVLRGGRLR
jgi:hypothetical protein